MSVTESYKTVTFSVAAYVAIEIALRIQIAKAREDVAALSGFKDDKEDPMLEWAKGDLASLLAAQKELTA